MAEPIPKGEVLLDVVFCELLDPTFTIPQRDGVYRETLVALLKVGANNVFPFNFIVRFLLFEDIVATVRASIINDPFAESGGIVIVFIVTTDALATVASVGAPVIPAELVDTSMCVVSGIFVIVCHVPAVHPLPLAVTYNCAFGSPPPGYACPAVIPCADPNVSRTVPALSAASVAATEGIINTFDVAGSR